MWRPGQSVNGNSHQSVAAASINAFQRQPKFQNRYFSYINATPPDRICAKVFEMCQTADLSSECVVGISGCILSWRAGAEAWLMVRAMADAYCQRSLSPQTRLAVTFIFNDVVQKDPASFAKPGLRYFFSVIAPLVSLMPESERKNTLRVMDILRSRQIYTKEEMQPLKRACEGPREDLATHLLASLDANPGGKPIPATGVKRTLMNLQAAAQPALQGKIAATLKATRALSDEPRTSDAHMEWALSVLGAAQGSLQSDKTFFEQCDTATRTALAKAVSRAVLFVELELELFQYLVIDWCVCLEENKARMIALAEIISQDQPQQAQDP